MAPRFDTLAARLHTLRNRFDAASVAARRHTLQQLARQPLPLDATLVAYHDTLLFLCAHPAARGEYTQAGRELRRITTQLRAAPPEARDALANSGLPYTPVASRFSHDALRWMLAQRAFETRFDAFWQASLDLSAVLALTLPSLERGLTTAGLANEDLLAALQVPRARWLDFLVQQGATLDAQPLLKDHLFDALGVYVRLTPTGRTFSRTWNRLPPRPMFVPRELLDRFDVDTLLRRPLPPPEALDAAARDAVITVVRQTMALTARETDPATHLDPASLRLWSLERGLAVALYGMVPARQLPLESYVGFTCLRNGLPLAYGGAWVFGRRMKFGINIFEPYRGGESGYVMCQILRTYRQAFGAEVLEVEPYQYGRDNPDGIASGAFWFYYKHGFRPTDPELAALAEREQRRRAARPGHRSSRRTLLRFTEGELQARLDGAEPGPGMAEITQAVTALVRRRFDGDRAAAEAACVRVFRRRTGLTSETGAQADAVLRETALMAAVLAEVLGLHDARHGTLLARLVQAKGRDPYRYQRLLLELLAPPDGRPTRRAPARPPAPA